MTYKFIDVCAGIGAGRLGLENNGLTCIAHSEIDEDADATYRVFFGENENNLGDLMKIDTSTLPDFDMLIGGFPCQPFSSLGNREGFDDSKGRGQVIFGIIKILKEKNVPYFILENVKGFLSCDNGNAMKTVLEELKNAGYTVYWKLLNSADFGVAQRRQRIYIVGIRADIPHTPIDWDIAIHKKATLQESFDDLHGEHVDIYGKSWQGYLHSKYNEGKFDEETLLSEDYLILDRRNQQLRIYRDTTPTIIRGNTGLFYVYERKLYRINGYQALLLQGFSREFVRKAKKAGINPRKLLMQAGNAMTVTVIEAICKSLLKSISLDEI